MIIDLHNLTLSEFVILDAKHMQATPLAKVALPRRVPHGLHGSWMPIIASKTGYK